MVDVLQIVAAAAVSAAVSFITAYGAFRIGLEARLTRLEERLTREEKDLQDLAQQVSKFDEGRRTDAARLDGRIDSSAKETDVVRNPLSSLDSEVRFLKPVKRILEEHGSKGLERALGSTQPAGAAEAQIAAQGGRKNDQGR